MDTWKRLGGFIGSHLAVIAPICVALAVLFPGVFSITKPLVPAFFAFMTFQSALSNTFGTLAHVARRPAPVLVALLISAVVMPCAACALATLFFGSSPEIVSGIVLEYSVPVAVVSAMWTNMLGGDLSLTLGTILVSTLVAPFSIPLTLELLLGQTVELDVLSMVGDMLVQIALPAVAGTALNDLSRGRAARELSPVVAPAAKIALLLVILSNSTGAAPYVRALTPQLVAVALFVLLFAACGYALGLLAASLLRVPREQRTSMTFLVGMRNISTGAVIAGAYLPGEAMFPVVMGTLFQQVLAATYGAVLRRIDAAEKRAAEVPVAVPAAVLPAAEKPVATAPVVVGMRVAKKAAEKLAHARAA